MTRADFLEIERKYDVDAELEVPELRRLPRVEHVLRAAEVDLVATYFDTADLALAHRGITLRLRTGGSDAGWHLKLPVAEHRRTEMRRPAGDGDSAPPAELLSRVRGYVRDHPVAPVMTLRTRRSVHHLKSADGTTLADLCDDRVTAESWSVGAAIETWREWEVELVDGEIATLDDAESLLVEIGAHPSTSPFKLARVLGTRLRPPVTPSVERLREGSAGDLLSAYLIGHLERLEREDLRLRADGSAAVHQMRVAIRRLRSALATFRDLLEPGTTDAIRAELRWLGGVLAGARDAQVLGERLRDLTEQQPPDLVLGRVLERLNAETSAKLQRGRATAAVELDGDRYFRLLDDLDAFVAHPPFSAAGRQPADRLPRSLGAPVKRVWKRHRAVVHATTPPERDNALHEVRKAAKRLRYAAEVVRPVLGRRAKRLSRCAKDLQQVLGEHQDSVICRAELREIAIRASLEGENAFTYGRLHALEQVRAEALEVAYDAALAALPSRRLPGWLRAPAP